MRNLSLNLEVPSEDNDSSMDTSAGTSDISAKPNEGEDSSMRSIASIDDIPGMVSKPYYLESFLYVVKDVLNEPCFSTAFTKTDRDRIETFKTMSESSQLLYLIFYRRSRSVFRTTTVRLPSEISGKRTEDCYKELSEREFITYDLESLSDAELLDMLAKNELVKLASSFKIPVKGVGRKHLIEALIKTTRRPSLLKFFTTSRTRTKSQLRILTEKALGPVFFLTKACKDVVSRFILCFSLASESVGQQAQPLSFETLLSSELYGMLRVRMGEEVYPAYRVSRKTPIFRNADELNRYFELCFLRNQLGNLIMTSNFDEAYKVFQRNHDQLLAIFEDESNLRSDLPELLRRYSPFSATIRILKLGIEINERLRKYSEAVELIVRILSSKSLERIRSKLICFFIKRLLLDQGSYCGKLGACLKQIEHVFSVLKNLHPGHRLEIQWQIAHSLGKTSENEQMSFQSDAARSVKRRKLAIDQDPEVGDDLLNRVEELMGKLLPSLKRPPMVKMLAPISVSSVIIGAHRPLYLWEESEDGSEFGTCILHVEEWTLKHYIHNEGFEKGVHCESQVYTTLFGLLFYDLIYGIDRDDAFYSIRQSTPLDLISGDFYPSHKDIIDARLDFISSAEKLPADSQAIDAISKLILDTWTQHKNEHCVGVSWDLFPNSERDIVELFWCLGPKVVAEVCRLLISNYTYWCSGLPDLCVWSPSNGKSKIIEVKGPKDKLSARQIIWLDRLISFGADVEVCSVAAVPRHRFKQMSHEVPPNR